ncbi:MFS general substrate transporter [Coccomyxa subellipsoidea C-169]|uniref:MFS general substrate transporter n=1 Tax=Coccomyxa subellipsoidea (strain C-169) TaxID=574566 RepID=I0YKX9_COCSC|nr:MFS general substrate transporter [Coccomyxa subellipsoidea C-169]EIE19048.1 MFS general substrate transporter [Coccomyxa subellipsoidea C-169]|eukprot:XP_005643592.1 MFS general substrate transporter [Coccomyxa subellipsoidea C-169]
MAPVQPQNADAHPPWYTPQRLLALFCWVTFLVYLDQGVISSNGVNRQIQVVSYAALTLAFPPAQAQFNVGNVGDGTLPSAFLAGLLIASIVYSELTTRFNAFRMIGFGFGVWAIASVGCGLAPNFWVLLICRVVMGAGEASIITLTGPFIDDVAPPAQKTLWFGVLNLFPTLGIAAGYIFGGLIGPLLGWRYAFFIQALIGLPVVIWALLASPINLQTMHDDEDVPSNTLAGVYGTAPLAKTGWLTSLGRDLLILGRHPVFVLNMLAYCPVQGAFGSYIFWGPKAGYELFDLPQETIDLTFGVVTIATSIVAVLLGGLFIDMVGSSIRNAMIFCSAGALVGLIVIEAGFMFAPSFPVLIGMFALGELALFAGQAPCSAVQIWTVPVRLRPLASGMGTVTQHLFGDVPTPPFVGWMQGVFNDWRLTMGLLTLLLSVAVVLYAIGACLPGKDYRPVGQQRALRADKVVPDLDPEGASLLRGGSGNRVSHVRYVMFASMGDRARS